MVEPARVPLTKQEFLNQFQEAGTLTKEQFLSQVPDDPRVSFEIERQQTIQEFQDQIGKLGPEALQQQLLPEGLTPEAQKTISTLAIPTLFSMAGSATGNPLIETAFDVAGFGANVILGNEPFSFTQLNLALLTPMFPRAIVTAGAIAIQKGTAMKFAIQQRRKFRAQEMEAAFDQVDRLNASAGIDASRAITAHINKYTDFLELQAKKGAISFRQAERLMPVPSRGLVNSFYDQVSQITADLPVTALRSSQIPLNDIIDGVENVLPGLTPSVVKRMASAPDPVAITRRRFTNLIEDHRQRGITFTRTQKEQLRRQIRMDVQSEVGTISFQDVREALSDLGRRATELAEQGNRQELFHVNRIRDALIDTLDRATESGALSIQQRNMLKIANAANSKLRTMEEFADFSSQFITRNPAGSQFIRSRGRLAGRPFGVEQIQEAHEVIDARKFLDALNNPNNVQAVELVKRLRRQTSNALSKTNMLEMTKSTLRKIRSIQEFGERKLLKGKLAQRELSDAESLRRKAGLAKEIGVAEMTPPLIGKPISFPDLQTPFRLAFTVTTLAAGASGAMNTADDNSFGRIAAFSSAAVFPVILLGAMMTEGGQKVLLNHFLNRGGKMDRAVAGAMGSFLRASIAQAFPPGENTP